MRHVVAGFEHRVGAHCGSVAMVDALRVAGLDLTEEMAIGLGSAPHFIAISGPGLSPSRFLMGRSPSFEQDLCATLGVRFEERLFASFDEAWSRAREWIQSERPVLALTDLRYLPYYGSSTHFNGHRLVIAGFDDEARTALVADTHFPGLLELALEDLAQSLTSDAPPVTTTDSMLGYLQPVEEPVDLRAAVRVALQRSGAVMLEDGGFSGVGALDRMADEVLDWAGEDDWKWCARFAYQLIEKRGCGGGLFRRLYTGFLAQAAEADLADTGALVPVGREAADAWTELAMAFKAISERERPDFGEAAKLFPSVAAAERRLWEGVAKAGG